MEEEEDGDLEVMDLDGGSEAGEDTGDHPSPWEAGE